MDVFVNTNNFENWQIFEKKKYFVFIIIFAKLCII